MHHSLYLDRAILVLLLSAAAALGAPLTTPTPGCTDDTWIATSTTNAPPGGTAHTAIWTGSQMIVWGGFYGDVVLNIGGRYNPGTDSWIATNTTDAPTPRYGHTAVWTGSEMIVWGGYYHDGLNDHNLNSGGRYNPGTDTWTATSTTNAPTARQYPEAVWTGTEMIVWGGYDDNGLPSSGGRYNPSTDTWTATSTTNAPSGREHHTAVWTGSEMIVWGGQGEGYSTAGGRYNPGTDSWTATSTINVPTGREFHTAVWTGNQMIVWGGYIFGFPNNQYLNSGGRYIPGTDTWTATSTTNAPTARYLHTAVWTGSEMIVWGGVNDINFLMNTGRRYNPGTDSWTTTSTTNAPTARRGHTAVWTGNEMIVWDGWDNTAKNNVNTGGRYCAQLPTTPTPPPLVTISGAVLYCSNSVPAPVANVTLTLTGSGSGSILSDTSGNYTFSSLAAGGNYAVTPTKSALPPGSSGIDTVDVITTQRHFLNIASLPPGCPRAAADVNGDTMINGVDVQAIQRFALGLSGGTANVGKYKFTPASRSYPSMVANQTGQNYDALVFGDVASPFAEHPEDPSQNAASVAIGVPVRFLLW